MNTYKKFTANVFVAKCDCEHVRGDVIEMATRYGDTHEAIVFNKVGEADGCPLYSVVRADGFNYQEWAKKRADKYRNSAARAAAIGRDYLNKSNKDAEFLSLAEPIKVGHHSEARHRKMIDDAWNNMAKSVEHTEQAEKKAHKAEYWYNKAKDINLSMPDSLGYYYEQLIAAKEYHQGLKSGKYPKEHAYSVTYAKKKVNELTKKYNMAVLLWDTDQEV